jgi:hypothetical protein
MKLTLNECLTRINQILNYPAIGYADVYHFFDQAIEELNTSLRISLPTVTEMVSENTYNIYEVPNIVKLTSPDSTVSASDSPPSPSVFPYWYRCRAPEYVKSFYKWNGHEWVPYDKLYGICSTADGTRYYLLTTVSRTQALWCEVDATVQESFDLANYLPASWWTLFVIPYVCFKFSIRNGDSGALFIDEFTQGFQQLQSSYDVPNTVKLTAVAGLPAYRTLVQDNAENLNIRVPTRAIFDNMRVETGIQSVFGGFYESGGWGV